MALVRLEEPTVRGRGRGGLALFALGFRPFYLLAAIFAVVAIPGWLFARAGGVGPQMPALWWHAHEMIFGFAAAVVVGFLFTAGRNWTGLATPHGGSLAALAVLWLAGRIGMVVASGPLAALVDLAFLPTAALALARVLWRAGSHRNYFLIVILGLLTAANAAFHLGRLGLLEIEPLTALHLALALLLTLETIIAGRVVPSFTSTAIKGVRQYRRAWLDGIAIVATLLTVAAWALAVPAPWLAILATLAALVQTVRCLGWNPWATRGTPLLWILHVSHAWIPVGLALLAAASLGVLPIGAAVHAWGVGATGGLIIGMITRTALGHTGRSLHSGRIELAMYLLLPTAALARIASAVAGSEPLLHLAGFAWSLAFLLYAVRYGSYLLRARVDGLPG